MIDFYNNEKENEKYLAKYQCMIDNSIKILTFKDIQECLEYCKKQFKNFPKCFKS